jgi:hypothetical protein
MRVKVLFLGLIFIFLSGFISAQLSESDVVYVVPGEKVFHLEGCEKLGSSKTGMSVRHAREIREYEPCTECILSKGLTFYEKSFSTIKEVREDTTVYITKTGKKYHTEDCRYLSKSKIPISLKEAIQRGYTPCSVCSPPLIEIEKPKIEKPKAIDKSASIKLYITRTGKKYHRGSCSYLRKSKIPISLKKLCARGYTPCSRCNPPRCK